MNSHTFILLTTLGSFILMLIVCMLLNTGSEKPGDSPNYLLLFLRKYSKLVVLPFGVIPTFMAINYAEEYDYEARMTPLTSSPDVVTGWIRKVSKDGIYVEGSSHEITLYRPILQMKEGVDNGPSFYALRDAREEGYAICFQVATELPKVIESQEGSGLSRAPHKFAYNIQLCKNYNLNYFTPMGAGKYLSSVQALTIGSLAGYQSVVKKGWPEKVYKDQYIVVDHKDARASYQRADHFGYPNNKFIKSDIGKSFCAAVHTLVDVKVDDNHIPIKFSEVSEPGVYLWSCKAALPKITIKNLD